MAATLTRQTTLAQRNIQGPAIVIALPPSGQPAPCVCGQVE